MRQGRIERWTSAILPWLQFVGRVALFLSLLVVYTVLSFYVMLYTFYTDVYNREHAEFESWLMGQDRKLDVITVWNFAVGFYVLALVEIGTWWTMYGANDQTSLGKRLRHKKLGYALICIAMGTLYAFTLWAYHLGKSFTFWERFGVRILGNAGIVVAVIAGVLFLISLWVERRRAANGRAHDLSIITADQGQGDWRPQQDRHMGVGAGDSPP